MVVDCSTKVINGFNFVSLGEGSELRTFSEIKSLINAGLGNLECDLRLKNVNLVNVFSSEVYETDIYIKDGRIVNIDSNSDLNSLEVLNLNGKYAVPGFIDSHMHFESTLLSPEALAEVMVPHGTTTIFADAMEIANVAGVEGLEVMMESIHELPYRSFLEVSSRVPTAPGLETTGGIIGLTEVKELLDWDESISLGEMDPSKILDLKDEYLKKIEASLLRRKVVNGHAIGTTGRDLNVYASSGISDDHECVEYDELLERIRLGLTVMVREGSTERNEESLLQGVLENDLGFENLIFCTDDKDASDIKDEGHINFNVSKAIGMGVDPVEAIKMATINPAKHFRIEDEIGSITPGKKADILILNSLKNLEPDKVVYEGEIVAKNGELLVETQNHTYPDWIKNTVKLKQRPSSDLFKIQSKKKNVGFTEVNVIGLFEDQIINDWLKRKLPVKDGKILSDTERDILKMEVVERYGKNGNIGKAFVEGFGLEEGSIGISVSHDHHNIVVVGTNNKDMATCVNRIERLQGGLVAVKNGKIIEEFATPIGGLMSDKRSEEVLKGHRKVSEAASKLGTDLPDPFMTLSFISLPTVPELGLTDKGLIDVKNHELIDLET